MSADRGFTVYDKLIISKTFDRLDHNCVLRKLPQEPIIQSGHGHTRPM